jgi:ATPase subunit of ABC transporter with duplicated ATPase domains
VDEAGPGASVRHGRLDRSEAGGGAAGDDFSDEEDKLQIEEFKEQIQEAMRRCERYELSKQVLEFCSADAAVKGLEVPKSEVREVMMDGQKELKGVSILGQEGLGKTTLAKAVYEDVKGQFMCQGFVSVGHPTSVKATLVEILRQVKPEADDHEEASLLEKQTSEIITKLWKMITPDE